MADLAPKRRSMEPLGFHADQDFPDTQSDVLGEAARGHWDRFLDVYLAPCWREVEIECRRRGVSLADAPDLFQELMLRLLRDGEFKQTFKDFPPPPGGKDRAEEGPGRANLPGRYLLYRQLRPDQAARFRTFLKRVIRNILLENQRRIRRLPRSLGAVAETEGLEPWVDDSVGESVERWWVGQCMAEAARRLAEEANQARTRGEKRLFEILRRAVVDGASPTTLATTMDLDRSTVSELLGRARHRFLAHLQAVSGIEDLAELKTRMAAAPETLLDAMTAAGRERETDG